MNCLLFLAVLVCGVYITNAHYSRCPPGWRYCNTLRKCYFFSTYRANWQNAKSKCEGQYKGLLARPLNSGENNFLKGIAKSLLTRNDDGYWIGGNKCYKGWGWVGPGKSFTAIKWFDWGPNEPNNLGGNQNCIQLFCHHKFRWDDENCSRDKYFICERPMGGGAVIRPPPVSPCPVGWRYASNYCFYFSSGSRVSWDSAKAGCKKRGAILAEPRSKAINDFLKQTAKRLSRTDAGYWFGARRCSPGYGKFLWNSKHDPVTWNDWAAGEPNNWKNTKEDCAHLWCHRNFQWNDAPCHGAKYYICQKKRGPVILPPPPPPPPAPLCPFGWRHNSNYCFYFSSGSRVNWDAAKAGCKARGAILAEPRSKAINDFLKGVARSLRRTDAGYWFGARRCSPGYGRFIWNSKHDPVTWNDWASGEPNNWKNLKEDCAHLWCHRDFQWNDAQCHGTKYYVCQKRRVSYG